ncbi:hypothetical protein B9G55_22515 [Saccharibacillus sp. O16]|nr:hypothetical protein B9G55_22515 [Saccharibacillus sp. O16]
MHFWSLLSTFGVQTGIRYTDCPVFFRVNIRVPLCKRQENWSYAPLLSMEQNRIQGGEISDERMV